MKEEEMLRLLFLIIRCLKQCFTTDERTSNRDRGIIRSLAIELRGFEVDLEQKLVERNPNEKWCEDHGQYRGPN